ncbi:hypothetical protein [Poseidonocella sp. HB161398]|uniref:hypothetical protein n=1 Tax=Poseidonocella sp. HB161398 TaxID=2320855 RepID=UPI001108C772|nr:hypothetical protein [Poseidonocella sp. HB161398]
MSSTPLDHLPKSLRDRDCIRLNEEVERRKSLFRQARAVSSGLRTIFERQAGGRLTRAEGAVFEVMVLQNLRACVRKERHYRPTRAMIARRTGYSERTVSKAIARFKEAGLVVVQRYAKGGRLGDKGHGLATEFRSGCMQFLGDQLAALGYRLPKGLRKDLMDLARWAAAQVGERTEPATDAPAKAAPTGKKVPGTIMPMDRGTPSNPEPAPVSASAGHAETHGEERPALPPSPGGLHCNENDLGHARRAVAERAPLGRLARAALHLVPMPRFAQAGEAAVGGYPFALSAPGVSS